MNLNLTHGPWIVLCEPLKRNRRNWMVQLKAWNLNHKPLWLCRLSLPGRLELMSLDWGSETADHRPLNRAIWTWNLKVESWTFAVELRSSCTEIVSLLCEQLNTKRDNNTQRKFMPQSVPPLEVNSQPHPLTRSSWSGARGCVSRSLFCYGLPALLLNSSA